MIIDEIEQQWSVDCKLDLTDLEQATADTVQLHFKYSKYHNALKLRLSALQHEKNRMTLIRTDYWSGNIDKDTLKDNQWTPNARVILKSDIPLHLSADNILIEINRKIDLVQQAIVFVESILRMIHSRNFHIKNVLDNRKINNAII